MWSVVCGLTDALCSKWPTGEVLPDLRDVIFNEALLVLPAKSDVLDLFLMCSSLDSHTKRASTSKAFPNQLF